MERRTFKLNSWILFALFSISGLFISNAAKAQGPERQHIYASEGLYFNTIGKDECVIEGNVSIGYKFNNLSLFVPVSLSERLYGINTTKNFDIQGLIGGGVSELLGISDKSKLEFVLTGQSTLLNKGADYKYSTARFDIKHVARQKVGYRTIGIGIQYYKMYDGSLGKDGLHPCISIGFLL